MLHQYVPGDNADLSGKETSLSLEYLIMFWAQSRAVATGHAQLVCSPKDAVLLNKLGHAIKQALCKAWRGLYFDLHCTANTTCIPRPIAPTAMRIGTAHIKKCAGQC